MRQFIKQLLGVINGPCTFNFNNFTISRLSLVLYVGVKFCMSFRLYAITSVVLLLKIYLLEWVRQGNPYLTWVWVWAKTTNGLVEIMVGVNFLWVNEFGLWVSMGL